MKRLVLPLFLLLSVYVAFSQPSISTAIIPMPGDSISLINCQPANFQEEANGPNQTWDFSSLLPDPVDPHFHFKYIDPETAPEIDRYPEADIVAINATGQWIYYSFDGSLIELIGLVAEEPGVGTAFGDYQNPELESAFPIEYGQNWMDMFDGNNVLGIFSSPFNGTINGEVDAYGTLILPNGTFTEVLRIKEERVYQITGAPTTTSTLYRYVSATQRLWLLSMESFSSGPPLIYYREDPDVLSSTSSVNFSDRFSVYPNPLQKGQKLIVETDEYHDDFQFQLSTMHGQTIRLSHLNPTSSSSIEINLPQHLPAGNYLLRGHNATSFFVKKITLYD